MKTRLKLFSENLTQDEFNLAFDYTIKNFPSNAGMKPFDKEFKTFRDAIMTAFDFQLTKEGSIFWLDILERQREDQDKPLHKTKNVNLSDLYLEKMIAYNEIIGLAQGYLDVIVAYPERAEELAQNALEVIDLKYNETKKYAKRNN